MGPCGTADALVHLPSESLLHGGATEAMQRRGIAITKRLGAARMFGLGSSSGLLQRLQTYPKWIMNKMHSNEATWTIRILCLSVLLFGFH